MQGTSVHNDVLVVDVRISINLNNLTIEQVVSKMQTSHIQLITMLADEFRFSGAPAKALSPLDSLKMDAQREQPSWFNVPQNFQQATTDALAAQERVVKLLCERKAWGVEGESADSTSRSTVESEPSGRDHDPSAGGTGRRTSKRSGSSAHLDTATRREQEKKTALDMVSTAMTCSRSERARGARSHPPPHGAPCYEPSRE